MMNNKILIFIIVMYHHRINDVDSQPISGTKCFEYSRIPINPLKPFPHMAVWYRLDDYSDETDSWQYVSLISDTFLIGHDFDYDNSLGTILFDINDVHSVINILKTNSSDSYRIVLLQINRIAVDINHRPACLLIRNDFLPDTVEVSLRNLSFYDLVHAEDFKPYLTSIRVSSNADDYRPISNDTTIHSLYFEKQLNYSHDNVALLSTPFPYLPPNYYVYGVGGANRQILPLSERIDWIESHVWGTNNASCGKATVNINPEILHSQPTNLEELPWHAAIFYIISPGRREYKCGGTLLNQNTVLTAAHCISTASGTISHDALVVILAKQDMDLNSIDSRESRITNVIVHESYNRHNNDNNIALLKLQTMMDYTKYIQPICITSIRGLFENSVGFLPSWTMNQLDQTQRILTKSSFTIRPQCECRAYDDIISAVANMVNENNFFAGYKNETSIHSGNSGGGLVSKINNQWFLRGIATVEVKLCLGETRQCNPIGLNLFTDVTQYTQWILQGMDSNLFR